MTVSSEIVETGLRKLKRGGAPFGTAAVFLGECTPPGLDGVRWRVLVTDGACADTVNVSLAGTNGGQSGMAVDPSAVETAVECRTGGYPKESRMTDFLAAYTRHPAGLGLHRGELDRYQ